MPGVVVDLCPLSRADSADVDQLSDQLKHPLVASTFFRGRGRERGGFYTNRSFEHGSASMARDFIARGSDGTTLGGASLVAGELCYFVDPSLWGRGFGTAIASAALAIGAASGRSTWDLVIYRHNLASLRIADRLGCRFTGVCHRPAPQLPMLRYTWIAG
jgi:RimJ/RimL family protein N-acetyltransferase